MSFPLRENTLRVGTLTSISSFSLLDRALFWVYCSSWCSLNSNQRDFSYQVLFEKYGQWTISRENTLLHSCSRQMFAPSSTVKMGCNFDSLSIQVFSKVLTVEIKNKHFKQILFFLNNRYVIFKVSLVKHLVLVI